MLSPESTAPLTIEQAFGLALRQHRRARGLSQEALAREAGYDRSYVGEVERGQKSPSLRAISRLARVVGVAPSALLAAAEARLPPPTADRGT